MKAKILALFARHGPMTVGEAMMKGLGALCNASGPASARYHLNQLCAEGSLATETVRASLPIGLGRARHPRAVRRYRLASEASREQ